MPATRPQTPPADPLADLRATEQTGPPVPPTDPVEAQPDGTLTELDGPGAVFDQAWHEDAITQVVKRWHADLALSRMMHKGGACPCARAARLALLEAVGVTLPEVVDPDA